MPAARPFRYWLFAAVVMILTAALRRYGWNELAVTVDESSMFGWAVSVLEHGYPMITSGTVEIHLATYELYSYILALSLGLFGASDFALRLPSFLFAVGTAYLIYSVGCRWFNLRTGLIAGLLYATSPWAIYWGQNGFHPQANQFFAMLTLIQAVNLLKMDPVPTRTYYLAALFVSCGFLCWEGLGFILPILLVSALIVRWGDWNWLKNHHLWIACVMVIVVILVQGVRRILVLDAYLTVGTGRGEITGPQLAFLLPDYQPYFYVVQLFGTYTQFVVAIVFGLGLVLVRRHWYFRFLATFVITAVVIMSGLLSYYSLQYIYFALPAFLIAVAAASVMFADWLAARAAAPALPARGWASPVTLALLAGLELATAGDFGLKTYSITAEAKTPPLTAYGVRRHGEMTDYAGLAASLRSSYVPGDLIISNVTHALQKATGLSSNVSLANYSSQKVLLDPGGARIFYQEKWTGRPVLRTQREFDNFLARSKGRIWIDAQPSDVFVSTLGANWWLDVRQRSRLMGESYRGKFFLVPR